ncbi:DddA-like double-stranded DNA deaminase toxin [Lentzea cavernae]|uniref:DddA-like double-stranded DNA deaminase toxin n=1 Tax=Lentzea cavernae TaxID=2020703 RepID=UPI0035714A7C
MEPAAPISSGEDHLHRSAVERLRELGARHTPVTAVDVEIKLAARMARSGITEATVVINKA